MIATSAVGRVESESDRVIVVGRRAVIGPVFDELRARLPGQRVTACDSYLAGIAEVSRSPARVVVAWADDSLRRLDAAVAALREAAGPGTKLLLCCTTAGEATARRVLSCGADDYLLFPFDPHELDTALGIEDRALGGAGQDTRLGGIPQASMEELDELAHVLSMLGEGGLGGRSLLEKIAGLLRTALQARAVSVVASGSVVTAGGPVAKPVLSVPLSSPTVTGRIALAERTDGAYGPGDAEKLKHYASVVSHILEAAGRRRQWESLALTDECSGLPNRRFLHQRLDQILAQAAREKFEVTLLLFDVDDFKSYNDRYGHGAGDEILRIMGELFRRHCREQDLVTRYGGDEFAVVFWDPQGPRVAGSRHPSAALPVLERVTESLRTQRLSVLPAGQSARLTISGGLATFPWDGATREALVKRADEALLAAKRAGKNRIVVIGS